jgi:hypothetical protein
MCTHDALEERLTDKVAYRCIVCGKADEELVFYVHIVFCPCDCINVCLMDTFLYRLRV